MKKSVRIKFIKNQKGMLSLDFLFGIIITFVVMLLLLRVSFSLMITEVAQYIAFSVARAHSVGDIDLVSQRKAAKNKFTQLVGKKVWQSFFKGPFELATKGTYNENILKSGGGNITGANGTFSEYVYSSADDGSNFGGSPFIGVVLPLKLTWMNTQLSFLGSSSESDSDFKTKVTGFVLREPSQFECQEFMKESNRYEQILKRDDENRFSNPAIEKGKISYVPMEDNGC